MTLYHGSNIEVKEPHLLNTQRALDFGRGFYTTSDFEQAKKWAKRTAKIRESGKPCVSCYELDEEKLEKLKVLRFAEPNLEWLDYVSNNRKNRDAKDDWDLVIGPVANDQTFPTILLYLDGYIDAESAIKQLLPQNLKDQYTFKTEKSLSLLRFTEVRSV